MSFGNIILSSNKKGLVPKLIRFFTESKYSHSLISTPDLCNVPMIVEAASIGVSFKRFDTGYENNPDEEFIIYDVLLDDKIKEEALQKLFIDLQLEYGYLELPWFIWRYLNKLVGRNIKGQDNWAQKGVLCSDLCRIYLEYCGLTDLFKDFGQGSLNAEDLRQIMENNPNFFKQRI